MTMCDEHNFREVSEDDTFGEGVSLIFETYRTRLICDRPGDRTDGLFGEPPGEAMAGNPRRTERLPCKCQFETIGKNRR